MPKSLEERIRILEDVKEIKKLGKYNITGMIIGKALYTDAIKLPEAIKIAK